jgi:GxxExxY protein
MTKRQITQLSYSIVGCAITVHKELGPGLLESIYETCLKYELEQNGFYVQQQVRVPVIYKGLEMQQDLRFDLMVNKCVVVEVKAIENILPIHKAQLLTYMKLLEAPQGLLINFHTDNISNAKIPMVNRFFDALPD